MQIAEKDWESELKGKTLRGIRSSHPYGQASPETNIIMRDGTSYRFNIKDDVYYEGALINTLHRAQPITEIYVEYDTGTWTIEVWCGPFPCWILSASGAKRDEQPFTLTKTPFFPHELGKQGVTHA